MKDPRVPSLIWPTVNLCVYDVHICLCICVSMHARICVGTCVWMHVCFHEHIFGLKLTFMSSLISLHFICWGKVPCGPGTHLSYLSSYYLSLEFLPLEGWELFCIGSGDLSLVLRLLLQALYSGRHLPAPAVTLGNAFFLTLDILSLLIKVSLLLGNLGEPLFQFLQ